MSAFSTAFNQFFRAFALFFTVVERLFQTADNLATVAEESSGSYKDQARIDRQIKVAALEKSREQRIANEQARLEAPATAIVS